MGPVVATSEDCHFPSRFGPLKTVTCLLLLAAVFAKGGNTYRSQPLDTFHEGESLGPAVDYMHGKVPYRDTIFIHGPFQDPLRSVLAFKLFGQSIAAFRSLQSLLGFLTLVCFLIASYFLYYRNVYYMAISVFFLITLGYIRPFGAVFQLSYTDIPLLGLVAVGALIQQSMAKEDQVNEKARGYILLFLFSFIASAAFSVSVDKGLFLSMASLLCLVAVCLIYLTRSRPWCALVVLGGYTTGMAAFGLSIGWAYGEFWEFFAVLARYEPFLNGLVYPFEQFEFLLPVIFVSATLCWLTRRFLEWAYWCEGGFRKGAKEFYVAYFVEILFLILSVAYFRRALGRSDVEHVASVTGVILMSTMYILMKHYLAPLLRKRRWETGVVPPLAVFVLVAFLITFAPRINWAHWYKLPLDMPDEAFITEDYHDTIDFLKKNMSPDEAFLTLTSEASWYYFLEKPCPIRFSVIYHAMPYFYQKEIVRDLQKGNVKFVLYRNGHWANAVDGVETQVRVPMVVEYIRNNYELHRMIGDNEIWIRKDLC
ncbi:MAG: hypothetical protein SWE60_14155 [Thermodesulfobacteriota bacterium]|nr:hypothetical protein [Thermodesulfobacteriota bacterium]